jgi:hypothetical protein
VKILKAAIGDSNVSKIWLRRGEAMDISVAIDVVEAGQLCALMWSNTGQNTDTRIRVILQAPSALSYRSPFSVLNGAARIKLVLAYRLPR